MECSKLDLTKPEKQSSKPFSDQSLFNHNYMEGKRESSCVETVKVDSLGKMEWNRTYGESGTEYANSVVATNDEGYAVAGSARRKDNNTNVWLIKVDALGNMQWNQSFGGPLSDYCDLIVNSNKGELLLACISQPPTRTPNYGDGDFWLAKVDSHGNLLGNQT